MKVLLCFGTRPEAIKMASLYHHLRNHALIEVKLCVTAQHREMLDQVLAFFEIVPDYDLNLMKANQTLNDLSSIILSEIDVVLVNEKPDLVLVHGDTTTSSMVALASFHRGIKVGHVEAGLRTYDKKAPFPEEINRQITSRVADFHFAPTTEAKNNLVREGILEGNVMVTGNTVIDALIWTKNKLKGGFINKQIEDLKFLKNVQFILVTGHRRENFGDGLISLCEALLEIIENNNVQIVFPVHLNPNVQGPVNQILGNHKNIHLLEPIEYPVMVWLMNHCSLIISDSGGIQEEAPTLKKHILVTREVSERPEGIEVGFSTLVGSSKDLIVEKANYFLKNGFVSTAENPFGDGDAAKRITTYLESTFK
jgi:UDP-N-acetylglucosamine 2-epimerase (non-hydrolysing)